MVTAAILVIFPLCMAMAACSDLITMTIPNRVSVVLLVAFVAIAPFAGLTLSQIGLHLAAGAIVFGVCFALFAFNIMGGGDAKILTASAVWFGLSQSLVAYLSYISVFGGMLSILVLLIRAKHDLIVVSRIPMPATMLDAKKVPYGVAIGAAGLLAFPSSPLIEAVIGRF
jgi:prepilin peptidase CpaA